MIDKYVAITDANHRIGTGHLMRQISLAQTAIKSGITPILLSNSTLVAKLCKVNNVPFIFANRREEITHVLDTTGVNHLIIDVHERDFNLFRSLCNHRNVILMVSEVGFDFPPFGDHMILVGSNLHEWNSLDEVITPDRNVQIHSGRAWMVFRDEFRLLDNEPKHDLGTILICHGGSDPFMLTQRCLKAIELIHESYRCNILITDLFTDVNEIYNLAQKSRHKCNIIKDSPCPWYWMRRSTVALINGGNVRYELCITQTPFIAISFQPQQYKCTEQITTLGAGINLGEMNEVTDEDIACTVEKLLKDKNQWYSMHNAMGTLFDMGGSERILNLLTE